MEWGSAKPYLDRGSADFGKSTYDKLQILKINFTIYSAHEKFEILFL